MPATRKALEKSTSDEMGAMGQAPAAAAALAAVATARGQVKIKSASVESNTALPSITCSACSLQVERTPAFATIIESQHNKPVGCKTMAASQDNLKAPAAASKPRSFLSPFGGHFSSSSSLSAPRLRPSVSTSCLFSGCNDATTAPPQTTEGEGGGAGAGSSDSNQSSGASLVACMPTRAALTHEWRKLKTPNKCRECNLLVYFNGRECSCCGFVAHKKCLMVLVIKCGGRLQQLAPLFSRHQPSQRQQPQQQQQQRLPSDLGAGAEPGREDTRSAAARFFSRNTSNILLGSNEDNNNNNSSNNNNNNSQAKFREKKLAYLLGTDVSTAAGARQAGPLVVRPMFGRPMVEVDGRQVLDIISRFIYEIDTRGLTAKGVYRVSSIKSKVDKLCNYYDQNLSSLIDLSSFHPNIIANALKMYLRRLPEPLLTLELYPRFIAIAMKYPSSTSCAGLTVPATGAKSAAPATPAAAASAPTSSGVTTPKTTRAKHKGAVLLANHQIDRYDPNVMIDEFRQVTRLLPALNRDIVAMILRHLRRVADMAEENQMSAKNLSIIFGPTLLSPVNNKSLAIADNIHQARVVELMITWAYQIFPQ